MAHLDTVVVPPRWPTLDTQRLGQCWQKGMGLVPGRGQILASRAGKDQFRQALMLLFGKEKIPFSLIHYIQFNL